MFEIEAKFAVKDNENERQYIWRLSQYVDNGEMSWQVLADYVNAAFREDESDYRAVDTYRKPVQSAKAYYDDVFKDLSDYDICSQINEQRRELEKEKIKYRDERNEYNKQNRCAARAEQKLDYLEGVLKEQGRIYFPAISQKQVANDDKTMIVCLSDLHIGQTFNSYFGKYDSDIAKERLQAYLTEIKKIKATHNVDNCYVFVLGDMISGSIHKTIAVTNRENTIEQVKMASEYISSFCYELCEMFSKVTMCSVAGNHSRIEAKEDALHDERLDDLTAWIVGKTLSHVKNFFMVKNHIDNGIGSVVIHDKEYILVHGDFDNNSKSGIANLSLMLRRIPYSVFMGHKHYATFADESNVKIVQCGCLVGSGDSYTVEKRLGSRANQTICICSDKGIECLYPVELS